MHLLLSTLLTLTTSAPTPAPQPSGPFDGGWTILSVEKNGKKTEAYSHVTIRNGRLVLNEVKGEQPITMELASNHEAWLWAGASKSVMVPADEYWITDDWLDGGYGPPRKITVTPAHRVTVAQQGFYLESGGQLQVFFLPKDDGPSLVLTLRRESSNGQASGRQGR